MDISQQSNEPPKDVRQLLEENQRLLRLVLSNTEKTRKYIMLGRVVSMVYVLLIVGSIVLAAITLPPLLKSAIAPYKDLLGISAPAGGPGQVENAGSPSDFEQLLDSLR